ncbi:hypothetical protein [Neobacillus sp. LXY-4]|uniref:hypothetical protein n=1 Tax=Neobacillus sp. LXY-4 TaxID=3379826 RepID=UPI003EE0C3DD
MALVIVLNLIAIVGIFYGITKKNKKLLVSSVIGLIIIEILILVYNYFYSLNPY